MANEQTNDEIVIRQDADTKVIAAEVSVKVPGRDEAVKASYEKAVALTAQGAMALCGGDEAEFLSHFNYGYDLAARQRERSKVLAQHQDPNVLIERTVAQMVKAGFAEAAARELVKAQMASQG